MSVVNRAEIGHNPPVQMQWYAGVNDAGKRFDRIVRSLLPQLSLAAIYAAIRRGDIRLNGRRMSLDWRVSAGDSIELSPAVGLSAARIADQVATGSAAQLADGGQDSPAQTLTGRLSPASIIHRNAHIVAICKPIGIPVHGRNGCNALVEAWLRRSIDTGLTFRPAALHRLDRNSSGLLFFGASIEGARHFSALLSSRQVEKRYVALLTGRLRHRAVWDEPLARDTVRRQSHYAADGKPATTLVTPIATSAAYTLCLCTIRSGRTHQIRAHAGLHRHPLIGDSKYGATRDRLGYLLHAWQVELARYDDLLGFRRLQAPLPRRSSERLVSLFGARALKQTVARAVVRHGR